MWKFRKLKLPPFITGMCGEGGGGGVGSNYVLICDFPQSNGNDLGIKKYIEKYFLEHVKPQVALKWTP